MQKGNDLLIVFPFVWKCALAAILAALQKSRKHTWTICPQGVQGTKAEQAVEFFLHGVTGVIGTAMV